MTLNERKEYLNKLKDELKELDSHISNISYINKKLYEIERYALLSKIFVVEQEIEIWEENHKFRKEYKRVCVLKNVLKRIEKMAIEALTKTNNIERNSKIAADISKEIAKREWENQEGHPYKLKGDK
tara:strand:- start:37 stop:417 length:381 start_codon:yes stop_codon:yes gene_type:complete